MRWESRRKKKDLWRSRNANKETPKNKNNNEEDNDTSEIAHLSLEKQLCYSNAHIHIHTHDMRAERALSRDATSTADLDAKLLFYYYARSSISGAAVSRKTTPCHFNAQARAWKASWPPHKLFHLSPLKRSQLSFFCLCVTAWMPYAPYLLSFFSPNPPCVVFLLS